MTDPRIYGLSSASGSPVGFAGAGGDAMAGAFGRLHASVERLAPAFASVRMAIDGLAVRLDDLARTPGVAGRAFGNARDPVAAFGFGGSDGGGFDGLLMLEEKRLALGTAMAAATAAHVEAADKLAVAHGAAAGRLTTIQVEAAASGTRVWNGFAESMSGTFETLFSRIARTGETELSGLWQTVGRGFASSLSRLDFGPALTPFTTQANALIGGALTGNVEAVTRGVVNSVSGILGAGGAAAAGGLGASLGSAFLGPVTAAAAFILPKLFADRKNPGSSATFNLADGLLGEVPANTRDGGDPKIARTIGEAVREIVNPFIESLGATLSEGAFRGGVGYVDGQYRAAVQRSSLSSIGTHLSDPLGIPGVHSDLRNFRQNEAAATADFVIRSLLDGLKNGLIEGVSGEVAATLSHGLRTLASTITTPGYDHENIEALPRQLEFLKVFDETVRLYRDGARALYDYNAMLTAQREEIEKSATVDAQTRVPPLREFLADAYELLRPVPQPRGPALEGVHQLGLREHNGKTLLGTQTRDEFIYDDALTPLWKMSGRDGINYLDFGRPYTVTAPSHKSAIVSQVSGGGIPNPGAGFMLEGMHMLLPSASGFERLQHLSLAETGATLPYRYSQFPGTANSNRNLVVDTDILLGVLRRAGVDKREAVDETMGPAVAGRLREAVDAMRGMLSATLNELSLTETPSLPLDGFALIYESQKAKIEALRPELEKLNEDLEKFGQAVIDVDSVLTRGQADLLHNVQSRFRTSLREELDPDAAALREIGEEFESLKGQAQHLLLGDDAEVGEMIDRIYRERLDALGYAFDEAGVAVRTFGDVMDRAATALDRQVRDQASLTDAARTTVEQVAETRHSLRLDANLSPYNPLDMLEESRRRFATLSAQALDPSFGEGERDAARRDLGLAARQYLDLARDSYASSYEYSAAFETVDGALANVLRQTQDELSVAEQQLSVLEEIRDALAGPAIDQASGPVSFTATRGGQYAASSSGVVPAGFDLGYLPDRNIGILIALAAAGLPLPTGFGEGQLAGARQANAEIDAVVRTLGFANGGVMTSSGALALERNGAGGIARRPQLAIFGEGRDPEAYVPLPDGRTIPVTVSTPANDDFVAGQREANQLSRAGIRDTLAELRRLRAEMVKLNEQSDQVARLLSRTLAGRPVSGSAA